MKIAKLCISGMLLASSFNGLAAAPDNTLSVHVLNEESGLPAASVRVQLEMSQNDTWVKLSEGVTNTGGRIDSLLPKNFDMEKGIYKVTFATDEFYKKQNKATFFPEIPVVFYVSEKNQKLHIPLLLSAYGFSTYKGS